MWANILLIMKDLFIPRLLWVLLLCHKRPWQKLNGNVFCVFRKPQCGSEGWRFDNSVQCYWLVFLSLQYNESGRMHMGWVLHWSRITYCISHLLCRQRPPVATAILTAAMFSATISSSVTDMMFKGSLISRWVKWEIWHFSMKLPMTSLIRIILFSLF